MITSSSISHLFHGKLINWIISSKCCTSAFYGFVFNNQYVLPAVIETIDLNTTTLWCGFGLLDIMAIYW